MKNMLLIVISVIALFGCVSADQRAAKIADNERANRELRESYQNSRVSCANKAQCDKMFSLTKVFVQEFADMRVQMSDDTLISTYGSIDYGKIAMRGTKTPGAGDSATIDLIVTCKGMSTDNEYLSSMCKNRVTLINNLFKNYVETKGKQ